MLIQSTSISGAGVWSCEPEGVIYTSRQACTCTHKEWERLNAKITWTLNGPAIYRFNSAGSYRVLQQISLIFRWHRWLRYQLTKYIHRECVICVIIFHWSNRWLQEVYEHHNAVCVQRLPSTLYVWTAPAIIDSEWVRVRQKGERNREEKHSIHQKCRLVKSI